jgi:osmotically-inducible protein OsmY
MTLGMITVFMSCAAIPKNEIIAQSGDDALISTKVKNSLFEDASLNTLPIHVRTDKAVVQLTGFVDSAQSVTKAGEVAGRVGGVAAVKNDLVMQH